MDWPPNDAPTSVPVSPRRNSSNFSKIDSVFLPEFADDVSPSNIDTEQQSIHINLPGSPKRLSHASSPRKASDPHVVIQSIEGSVVTEEIPISELVSMTADPTHPTDLPPPIATIVEKRSWAMIIKKNLKSIIIAAVVLMLIGSLIIFLVHTGYLGKGLVACLKFVRSLGGWGPVILILIDTFTIPFLIPSTILNVGSGLLFGFFLGVFVACCGTLLGASLSFVLAHKCLPNRIKSKLDNNKQLQLVNRLLQSDSNQSWLQSSKIVILSRLPPLFPFPLFNYAFGLTKVKYPVYLFGTAVGMVPTLCLDVYLGTLLKDLTQVSKSPGWYLYMALAVTVVITIFISIYVKRLFTSMDAKLKVTYVTEEVRVTVDDVERVDFSDKALLISDESNDDL